MATTTFSTESDVRGGDACTARRPARSGKKRGDDALGGMRNDDRPVTAIKVGPGEGAGAGAATAAGGARHPQQQPGHGDAGAWYGRGEAPAPELPPPSRQKPPRSSISVRTAAGSPSEVAPFKSRASSSCSFGLRTPLSAHRVPVGPGPLKYKIPEQITRYGKSTTPSFSMGRRYNPQPSSDPTVPGPGEYSPETSSLLRGPAFTLLGRSRSPSGSRATPAPNQYSLPPCIGPNVPLKPYSGAVRFNSRPKEDTTTLNKSPGPAQYVLPDVSRYKTQAPRASITGNKKLTLVNEWNLTPAPSAYRVERACSAVLRRTPQFSFGVRHSTKAHTLKGREDA